MRNITSLILSGISFAVSAFVFFIISGIGLILTAAVLDGFKAPSYLLYFSTFFVIGIFLAFAVSLIYYRLLFHSRELSQLHIYEKAKLTILFMIPVTIILASSGVLGGWLIPFPIPPDATAHTYHFDVETGIFGFTTITTLSFSWNDELPIEEKVEKIRNTLMFYKDYTERHGGIFYDGSDSCEENLDINYQDYKTKLERLGGDTQSPFAPEIDVYCYFNWEWFLGNGPYFQLFLDENGGRVHED